MGGLLGGAKGMLAPLSNYWGPGPPLPTPMNYKSLRDVKFVRPADG